MPKIRDLGISVIPATMRPPEIGDGGASGPCHPTPPPSKPKPHQQCVDTPDDQCCPSDHDSNVEKDRDDEITPDTRKELQQQLRDRIGLQL
jgi:hypothetical protein